MFSKNVYLITKFIALLDYLRMSLIYFRIFNTIMFIYRLVINIKYETQYREIYCSIKQKIHDNISSDYVVNNFCSNITYTIFIEHFINLLPCIVIIFYPLIFFFIIVIFDKFLRSLLIKLVIGYIYNKLFGIILNIIVITNVYWNIGSTNWGSNQTSTISIPEVQSHENINHNEIRIKNCSPTPYECK
jgi:hypothetical protein